MISKEKIDFLNSLDNDYSRFIINVVNSFKKRKKLLDKMIKENNYNIQTTKLSNGMVNLDELWVDPYYKTIMRRALDNLLELLENVDIENIKENPNKFCKKIIFAKIGELPNKPEGLVDIVDFIKVMDCGEDLNYYAANINEESIFKHLRMYPWHIKDGCCYNEFLKCKHFNKANCNAKCMACTLFSCPFLSKMHITYYGREILLFKAFLTKDQMKHMIYDFYKTKNEVIKAILKK